MEFSRIIYIINAHEPWFLGAKAPFLSESTPWYFESCPIKRTPWYLGKSVAIARLREPNARAKRIA